MTVVISPLLSLKRSGRPSPKLNIRAATLNSDSKAAGKGKIINHLNESCPEQLIELLYITPEMINLSGTIQNVLRQLHKNEKLARIVIDEAHYVSQSGRDFWPDYVALRKVRKLSPNVPYMALTATATENVKVDVMHNLGSRKITTSNQVNLVYLLSSPFGSFRSFRTFSALYSLLLRFSATPLVLFQLPRETFCLKNAP